MDQKRGGDIKDKTEVLSEYKMQFGGFCGQPFIWVHGNALGYTGWLVDSVQNETAKSSALSHMVHTGLTTCYSRTVPGLFLDFLTIIKESLSKGTISHFFHSHFNKG